MKESSRKALCNRRNADSGTLDREVIEQLRHLKEDREYFVKQLKEKRKTYQEDDDLQGQRLSELQKERANIERKLDGLVDSLGEIKEKNVRLQVEMRIEKLGQERMELDARIRERKEQVRKQELKPEEMDLMCRKLLDFEGGITEMTVEQKRSALRALIRRAVWDGTDVHVFLIGTPESSPESETHWGEDSK